MLMIMVMLIVLMIVINSIQNIIFCLFIVVVEPRPLENVGMLNEFKISKSVKLYVGAAIKSV